MRKRCVTILAALLLASVDQAYAQDPPTKPVPPPTSRPPGCSMSASAAPAPTAMRRATSATATCETVRPRSSRWTRTPISTASTPTSRTPATATSYTRPSTCNAKVTVSGLYNGIPLNYLLRRTAHLDRRRPRQVHARSRAPRRRSRDRPTPPPTAPRLACPARRDSGRRRATPQPSAQAKANRSIYNNFLGPDDMSVLRSITAVSLTYRASPALAIRTDFTSTGRDGEMPWAASFAFNNANLLPAPIDHRNNELKLNTEWVNARGMFRVDYWGSFFDNAIQTLDLGQPDSRHRLQQRSRAAQRPVRSERLHQRQRPGVRPDGVVAEQFPQFGRRHRHAEAAAAARRSTATSR